jgi:uncharacterized membrane protein HdeD (DUF308 family)
MRWTLALLGGVLIAVGAVWILKGSSFLPGSFMTGQSLWLWIGIACVVVGLLLLVRGFRSARH